MVPLIVGTILGVEAVLASHACEGVRGSFVAHARDLHTKAVAANAFWSQRDADKVDACITLLGRNVEEGWRAPNEHAAFSRVMLFVCTSHISGTGDGVIDTARNYGNAAWAGIMAAFKPAQSEEQRHS